MKAALAMALARLVSLRREEAMGVGIGREAMGVKAWLGCWGAVGEGSNMAWGGNGLGMGEGVERGWCWRGALQQLPRG